MSGHRALTQAKDPLSAGTSSLISVPPVSRGPELGLTGADTGHARYDPHPLPPMEARMDGKSKTLLGLLLFNGFTD